MLAIRTFPCGDALAFLHIEGGVTDLREVRLTGTPGRWDVSDPVDLTDEAGLDGASHPDWFIPADQLPPPPATPTPAPTATPAPTKSRPSATPGA